MKPIALIVPMYRDPDAQRFGEFLECLRRNLENPLIASVHVFLESAIDVASPGVDSKKVVWVPHGRRVTYRNLFSYANAHLNDRLVAISNADIYFDDSLAQLQGRDLSGQLLCLSRWDVDGDGVSRLFEHASSQDAWMFEAPARLFACDFPLGVLGCDNRLAYEASRSGLRVSNPARTIRAHHLHLSGVRRYGSENRISGRGLSVAATFLDPPADVASVAFEESMGYTIGAFVAGSTSHNNEAREFEAVPEALRGLAYTQVVSGLVGPVHVEFLTGGKLYVLVGDDWYGHAIATEWLRGTGQRETLPSVRTRTGAGFDVWSVAGEKGDRMVAPVQVMLVAGQLEKRAVL